MYKESIDFNLEPPLEIDSIMNGHWDRLTSQQRYVHIKNAWFHKPGFAKKYLTLRSEAVSLRDTNLDNILNLDRGVYLCTSKPV